VSVTGVGVEHPAFRVEHPLSSPREAAIWPDFLIFGVAMKTG